MQIHSTKQAPRTQHDVKSTEKSRGVAVVTRRHGRELKVLLILFLFIYFVAPRDPPERWRGDKRVCKANKGANSKADVPNVKVQRVTVPKTGYPPYFGQRCDLSKEDSRL